MIVHIIINFTKFTFDEMVAEVEGKRVKTSGPIFRRMGGSIVWRGEFRTVVTGPEAMHWHDGFIASYPSADAFFEMIKDAEYQKAVVNRTAALADSRLVRFKPGSSGEGF